MSERNEKYWNALLKKFMEGSISADERFLLEKQALDDPFLFDALQGFSDQSDSAAVDEEKPAKKKGIPMRYIAIAASFILSFATISIFLNNNSKSDNQASENTTFAQVIKEESSDIPADEKNEISERIESAVNSEIKVTDAQVVSMNKETTKNESENNVRSTSKSEAVQKASEIKDSKPSEITADQVASRPAYAAGAAESASDLEEEIAAVESENLDTDNVGNVSVELPVESAKKKQSRIRTNTQEAFSAESLFKVVPVIGESTFNDFAKQKIEARGLGLGGNTKITIEFTIDENGRISNFKQMPSSCTECSAYAISLLQKSGEWQTVPSGKIGRGSYAFYF